MGGLVMTTQNQNAVVYFLDRHAEGTRAQHPAFIEIGDAGRQRSYGELAADTARVAGMLHEHGVQPGARAALIALDTIEFPAIFWGAMRAGVVPVPLNTLLTAEYYEIILNDAGAEVLFVSEALAAMIVPLRPRLPALKTVFVIGAAPVGMVAFADAFRAASPRPIPHHASADDTAFWLYSSGSTGKPKGVMHRHGAIKATTDTFAAQVLGVHPDDVMLSAAKLYFAYGLGNAMTFPMSVGATAALLAGRPTPDTMLSAFAAVKPTIFYSAPTLYAAIIAAAHGNHPHGLERLRFCSSAGEALPREIGESWKRLTGVDIVDGVGSTEMLHVFLANAPDNVVYGTAGVAVPGYELRLVDDHGADVAQGEIGEMLVKGPSTAQGYWNQPEKTHATFQGEWTRTGDKYERAAEGRYIYCGRTDDMFKVSGIWVSPFEVEQALVSHPAVLEAAVVAARDENNLEKPKAFVVLKGAATPDLVEALKAHVKASIGAWKYPRWIEVVPDLPKTSTGKIQRFKLR